MTTRYKARLERRATLWQKIISVLKQRVSKTILIDYNEKRIYNKRYE